MKSSIEEKTNMRFLGVFGRVREKIRINLRNTRCPFSVRLEQCSSIVVVSHSIDKTIAAQTTLIYRLRDDGSGWAISMNPSISSNSNSNSNSNSEGDSSGDCYECHDVGFVLKSRYTLQTFKIKWQSMKRPHCSWPHYIKKKRTFAHATFSTKTTARGLQYKKKTCIY